MIRTFVIFFVTAAPSLALATECGGFVGQRPSIISFDDAVRLLPSISPKGEFETTAQFETRRAAAIARIPNDLIIAKRPAKPDEYAIYDADTQQLRVKSYFFTDLPIIDYWDAIQPTEFYESLKPGLNYSNYGVTLSFTEARTGSYQAQNGYGARWTIERIARTQNGIFEREHSIMAPSSLFPAADDSPHFVGAVPVTPEAARSFRRNLMTAFVVKPAAPYVMRSTHKAPYGSTIQNPTETIVNSTILVGDIRCGLLISAQGEVLGAYETR